MVRYSVDAMRSVILQKLVDWSAHGDELWLASTRCNAVFAAPDCAKASRRAPSSSMSARSSVVSDENASIRRMAIFFSSLIDQMPSTRPSSRMVPGMMPLRVMRPLR